MAYMKSMHNRFKVDSNVITVVAINEKLLKCWNFEEVEKNRNKYDVSHSYNCVVFYGGE